MKAKIVEFKEKSMVAEIFKVEEPDDFIIIKNEMPFESSREIEIEKGEYLVLYGELIDDVKYDYLIKIFHADMVDNIENLLLYKLDDE